MRLYRASNWFSPTSLINAMKKDNKQCLLDNPRTVMINKENYYQQYKGHTNWLSLISSQFPKNIHFFMHMLIISVLYVLGGDSHIRTVQVCAARKSPIFRPWPPLTTTFSTWAAPKDPLFKNIQFFVPIFRPGQIEKTLVKELAPNPYFPFINVHLVDINVFAKIYEIPSMPFQGKTKMSRTKQYTHSPFPPLPPPPPDIQDNTGA